MGSDASIPYFFNLAPHYDLTVTPRITSKAGNMLKLGFRHLTQKGVYSVDLNGLWVDKKDNKDNDRSFRGNISARGEFDCGKTGPTVFNLNAKLTKPSCDAIICPTRIILRALPICKTLRTKPILMPG